MTVPETEVGHLCLLLPQGPQAQSSSTTALPALSVLFGLSWDGPELASSWNIESKEKLAPRNKQPNAKPNAKPQAALNRFEWKVLIGQFCPRDSHGKLGGHVFRPASYLGSRYGIALDCVPGTGGGRACVCVLGGGPWLEFEGGTGIGQAEWTACSSKYTFVVEEHRVVGELWAIRGALDKHEVR